MKTYTTFQIEITRHNVTPAQFLSYVRRMVDMKGGKMIRSDLSLGYFAAGNDLNFDVHHDEPELAGLHERSVSKPYEMQTYLRYPNGAVYNEICEFTFDDEKTGWGYYYLVNVEAVEEQEEETSEPTPALLEKQRADSINRAYEAIMAALDHEPIDYVNDEEADIYEAMNDLQAAIEQARP